MILYVLSIFVSAFLLFQVQPMISRYILPYFGGTPAVWSTVQLFFQIFLTGGYAYAFWLVRRSSSRKQVLLHLSILASSLLLVITLGFFWPSPVTPGAGWRPQSVELPVLDIFKLLLVAVGLPYFLLSTNSPLTQAWFARSLPGRSPYWLYALSNIGSLLGLLAYPFVIEPNLALKAQGWMWAGGYALFVVLAGYTAIKAYRTSPPRNDPAGVADASGVPAVLTRRAQVLWILFSALGTTLLLAITSQVTQEVAAIPLLWVVPLSIYLLTFIITYSGDRWYKRKLVAGLTILASVAFLWALVSAEAGYLPRAAAFCLFLFFSLMMCNGETYRLRPDPSHLTRFYLLTSVGGALGGIFVNLVAPFMFKGYWELLIGFGLALALALVVIVTRSSTLPEQQRRFSFNVMTTLTILLVGAFSLYGLLGGEVYGDAYQARNFFGVVRVKEVNTDDPAWRAYNVSHGVTIHGLQFLAPDKRDIPTAYYSKDSGFGLAMLNHPRYGQGMRVGVLGLGIGTMAAYGQPGDTYRMYEINPVMAALAEGRGGYFSFLADSLADTTIILGDARLSLENELATHGSNNYDLLALDVFSSDSIPVHLTTKEAFGVYLQHLAPGGVLAVNISTRYLDLIPVMWNLSQYYRLYMVVIPTQAQGVITSSSLWVLMSHSPAELQLPAIASRVYSLAGYSTSLPFWTDDYSNLFQILR